MPKMVKQSGQFAREVRIAYNARNITDKVLITSMDATPRLARDYEHYGVICVVVETPFTATWTNPIDDGKGGLKDLVTKVDYAKGDIIICGNWRPEGYSDCRRASVNEKDEPREDAPHMWLDWDYLAKCRIVIVEEAQNV